jgi:3-methyladenine DNA glycosylase AlkD
MKERVEAIIDRLRAAGNERDRVGMARFGINVERAFGVSVAELRRIAREVGRDHSLAAGLWRSGWHEARILAALVDEPARVTEAQLERWVLGFDSWDLCDLTCGNLFDRTPWAYEKAFAWAERDEEFVKRAGFVLMAALAVHDKAAGDAKLRKFLPVIARHAADERNFVKKAVNWALRQIGKRNAALGEAALETARRMERTDSRAARWAARDAIRELERKRAGLAAKAGRKD